MQPYKKLIFFGFSNIKYGSSRKAILSLKLQITLHDIDEN